MLRMDRGLVAQRQSAFRRRNSNPRPILSDSALSIDASTPSSPRRHEAHQANPVKHRLQIRVFPAFNLVFFVNLSVLRV